jgi:hypothetical protein
MAGIFRKGNARFLPLVVEQAQLDALGRIREEREIGSCAIEGRTERVSVAGPDSHRKCSRFEMRRLGDTGGTFSKDKIDMD